MPGGGGETKAGGVYVRAKLPSGGHVVSSGKRTIQPVRASAVRILVALSRGFGAPGAVPYLRRTGKPSADEALPSLPTVDTQRIHTPSSGGAHWNDFEMRSTPPSRRSTSRPTWFPAVAGFAVTVLVHTLDATSGWRRYLPPAFKVLSSSHLRFIRAVDTFSSARLVRTCSEDKSCCA